MVAPAVAAAMDLAGVTEEAGVTEAAEATDLAEVTGAGFFRESEPTGSLDVPLGQARAPTVLMAVRVALMVVQEAMGAMEVR